MKSSERQVAQRGLFTKGANVIRQISRAASGERQPALEVDLKLTNWNIVYQYGSYFLDQIDIPVAAEHLVESGLCLVVDDAEGTLRWRGDGAVERGTVSMEPATDHGIFSIRLPEALQKFALEPGAKERKFLMECALQACRLRYAEQTQLSNFVERDAPHLRGFMSPICFDRGGQLLTFYPQLKLYRNGVVILELRLISPDRAMGIKEFVDGYVNFYQARTVNASIAPAVLRLDTRNQLLPAVRGILRRRRLMQAVSATEGGLAEHTFVHDAGDFAFNLVPVDPHNVLAAPTLSLHTLVQHMFSAVEGALNAPRLGTEYVLRGQKERKYVRGDYWGGRLHVHILQFENQPEKASQIRQRYGRQLAAILGRTSSPSFKGSDGEILHETLRPFEDSTVHMNEAIALHVYAAGIGDALVQHQANDPNHDEVVSDKQAQQEFIDFVRLSYMRLVERSTLQQASVRSMFSDREELFRLEVLRQRAARFGEVGKLFEHAWSLFNIDQVKESIRDNNHLRLERLNEVRDQRWRQFGWILAIGFGLVGTSTFSEAIVEPTWRGMLLPIPAEPWEPAFFYLITATSVGLILALVYVLLARMGDAEAT